MSAVQNAMQAAVADLLDEYKATLTADPADELVAELAFSDDSPIRKGQAFRLQHPGALASVRIFSDEKELDSRCLEFFCAKVATPSKQGSEKLQAAMLGLEEAHDFWTPLAWRFLRWGNKIAPARASVK